MSATEQVEQTATSQAQLVSTSQARLISTSTARAHFTETAIVQVQARRTSTAHAIAIKPSSTLRPTRTPSPTLTPTFRVSDTPIAVPTASSLGSGNTSQPPTALQATEQFISISLSPRGCGATYKYTEPTTWTVSGYILGVVYLVEYSPIDLGMGFDPMLSAITIFDYDNGTVRANGEFNWTFTVYSIGNWQQSPPLEFGVVADLGAGPTNLRKICRAYRVPWDPTPNP